MNDTILLIAAMALTMLLWSRVHHWTIRALRAESALDRIERCIKVEGVRMPGRTDIINLSLRHERGEGAC